MIKKTLRLIESKRNSKNPAFKLMVKIKDSLWKMLYKNKENSLFLKAIKNSKNILHIGANTGQEAGLYAKLGKKVVWIEADPENYKILKKNISKYKNQEAINELVVDKDNKEYSFHISSNNRESSSIFEFGKYISGKNSIYKNLKLKMTGKIKITGKTLRRIYQEHNLYKKNIDLMVLDVQGAELKVLKGSDIILKNLKYIITEASQVEIYKKGVNWKQLKRFLNKKGFYEYGDIPIVGDILFANLTYPSEKEVICSSQIGQDLWVLKQTRFKKNGYFVDIGAYDGRKFSNTYTLEKQFKWEGICADPLKTRIKENRSCFTEKRAVFSKSGQTLPFECNKLYSKISKKGKVYVKTVSLYDLLKKYRAPKNIDYLSIDTEGCEYSIIQDFPFEKYSIHLITIEHNANSKTSESINNKKKIEELLKSKGYSKFNKKSFVKKYSREYSKEDFEDWYIK